VARGGGTAAAPPPSARIQTRARSDARARDIAREVRVQARAGSLRTDGPATGTGESWSVSYSIVVPERADLGLTAVNGPVSVRGVTGRLRATTTNGPLSLDRVNGDVHGRTTNGPLTITLDGSRWQGAGLDAETRNGPVRLRIPEGYSAQLETGSVNGPLNLGFPVTVTLSGRRTNRLETTLGDGGPPIRAVTTNGPVTVDRP
jgi:hypothetical protein